MIRRITLKNFMSHAETVFDLSDGLTVLTGENNCGKSAVVAALQVLCRNPGGDTMVRHGARECRVIVETDDGHTVEWRRLNGSVSYVLDGREVHRVGRTVPDDVHALLRLPLVAAAEGEDKFFEVHFAEQKKPIFLLGDPGSHAAQFFASSSDAANLVQMQRRHRERLQEARREEKRLAAEAASLEEVLASLTPVPDLEARVEEASAEHVALLELGRARAALAALLEQLTQSVAETSRWSAAAAVLVPLAAAPRLEDPGPLAERIEELARATAERGAVRERVTALEPLVTPPSLEDPVPLESLLAEREALDRRLEGGRHRLEALDDLAGPPRLAETGALAELIDVSAGAAADIDRDGGALAALATLIAPPRLEDCSPLEALTLEMDAQTRRVERGSANARRLAVLSAPPELADERSLAAALAALEEATGRRARASQAAGALAPISPPPVPAATAALEALSAALGAALDVQRGLEGEAAAAGKALALAAAGLREWAESNPICPTCGQAIDPDRLIRAVRGADLHGRH